MFRFYALPAWQLLGADPKPSAAAPPPEAPLTPALGDAALDRVLGRAEYRGELALERALALLEQAPGPVVFARPPNDLPALLRTADQLVLFARQEAGERAMVWRCECGTRYAVPVSLFRPVALRCERCDRTIELDAQTSQGESHLTNPVQAQVNAARHALAGFFREAMSRGWPVLVAKG
ncbi:MAG: hypothetical protein AB1730_22350 [Myxococcota bacterium]|jgi:hypothetical protein